MRKIKYVLCFTILSAHIGFCQIIENDILLLRDYATSETITVNTKASNHTPSSLRSFYKRTVQKQIGKVCVYEMECGEFAKKLFAEFGVLKSTFLTIDRMGRCTHISTLETLPLRLTKERKIIEQPADYRAQP